MYIYSGWHFCSLQCNHSRINANYRLWQRLLGFVLLLPLVCNKPQIDLWESKQSITWLTSQAALMHAEGKGPSCSMLMYCDGFMHVCSVSSLLDVCEAGGAEWMGKGRWGKFITAPLTWAVKHDWGHKVPTSLSIPGEISQSLLTVINVSGDAWCCRGRAGTAGFVLAFDRAQNSSNVALADRYLKWTIMDKSLCSLLNLCPTNKIGSMLTTAEGFGIVASSNPHSVALKLKYHQ